MTALAHPSPAAPVLDAVWRASELSPAQSATVPSGHAGLDAQLPGAGWPRGQLTELLQTQAGLHEWRVLLPALQACHGVGALVCIGNPHPLNLAALACRGIPAQAWLWVDVAPPAERLWAAEQTLRCQDLAALLLWAPQVRTSQLRRLQVAAQATGQQRLAPLVFVFRPWAAQQESSPAPLRVGLRLAAQGQLQAHLFKRRGPPLADPVLLAEQLPPALLHRASPAPPSPVTSLVSSSVESLLDFPHHAVDRPRTVAHPLPGRSFSTDQPLAA